MSGWGSAEDGHERWLNRTRIALVSGAVGVAIVFQLLGSLRSGDAPEDALERLTSALRKADIETLVTDVSLGYEARAQSEIQDRGRAIVEKALAVFERREDLGRAQVRSFQTRIAAIRERVREAGVSAFAALPTKDKWTVWVDQPRDAFLVKTALGSLTSEDRGMLPTDISVLDDQPKLTKFSRDGCAERLSADDKSLLKAVREDPSLMADAIYGDVLRACDRAAEAKLRSPIRRYREALQNVTRIHGDRPQGANVDKRQVKKEQELSASKLTGDEATYLERHGRFEDLAVHEVEATELAKLGQAQLTPEEVNRISDWTPHDLESRGSDRMESDGKAAYAAWLTENFAKCRYRVRKETRRGSTQRSLFRSTTSVLKLGWNEDHCAEIAGSQHILHFKKGRWAYAFDDPDEEDDAGAFASVQGREHLR